MKIFHLGLCVGEPPFDSMRKAFLNNCTEYRELSTGVKNVNHEAMQIARSFRPDIIFMQIQAANIISIQTVKEFKRLGCWVCNWNGDIRHNTPEWMVHMSRIVDKTLFTNMRDVHNVSNGGYLEIGYDPDIYCPEGDKLPCREIAFFGNNYGPTMFPLSELRIQMDAHLRTMFPRNYGTYGTNWMRGAGNLNHSQAEEAKAYRSVKVGINLSHFDEPMYSSDRILRIMGTGVFCLAKRYPDMPFVDGEHLRTWGDLNELTALIRHYISNTTEREQIASKGHQFVKENYTFDNMVKNLLKIYKA